MIIAGKHEYPAMKKSVFELIKTLADAKGGILNLGKGSRMATEHNWALTKPELFAQTLRAWIEDKPLPEQIEEIFD